MADGITFRMLTEPFQQAMAERERRMPGAARWAVRQAGRVTQKAARAQTPVLKDATRSSYGTIRARQRRGLQPAAGTFDRPVPGLLRASIRPSRRLKDTGVAVSLKVGPRGQRAHLYAEKIEARAHYMDAGEMAGRAAMGAIAAEAFGRVWRGV